MLADNDSDKDLWIQDVKEHSDQLFELLRVPISKTEPSTWKSTPITETVGNFLLGKKSNTKATVWLRGKPRILLEFPCRIEYPLAVTMTLWVFIDLQPLKWDDNLRWQITSETPEWVRTFLNQFYDLVSEAEKNKDIYLQERDAAFVHAIRDPELNHKYQLFRNQFFEDIRILTEQFNSEGVNFSPDSELDPGERGVLDAEGKKAFDNRIDIIKRLKNIDREEFGYYRRETHSTLPESFEDLGPEKARALGFLPTEVMTLESEVEWADLRSEWRFGPDGEPDMIYQEIQQEIRKVDWTPIFETTEFKVWRVYFDDIQTYGFWDKSESEETRISNHEFANLIDFESVIDLLEDDKRIPILGESPIEIERKFQRMDTTLTLRQWLENGVLQDFQNLNSGLLILDPDYFAGIPRFPSNGVLIQRKDSPIIFDACWKIIQSNAEEKSFRLLAEKYTKIMEESLSFLFESAGKEIQSLEKQVGILVDEISEINAKIEKASKIVIEMAGSWTPTWISKEIHVLKRVIENAEFQELPRKLLITRWSEWLNEKGLNRSERELRSNLRGLERANVLERYGISSKRRVTGKAGSRETVFYIPKS